MKKWLLTLITVASASVISLQAQTYCTTSLYTSGCSVGDNLDNVTIGTLVQTSTGCSAGAFGDYTTDTIAIAQTEATTIALTSGYSNQWYGVWIDANDDGDFADAGEFLWNSTSASSTAGTVTSGSFVIPTTVTTGTHRLRVRGHYAGSAFTATESCTSFTYGETHDYTVNVLIPPVCPTPYGTTTTAVTAYGATLHWVSTGTSFSVEYGLAGFTLGSGTTVTSTNDSVVLTGLTPASNYTFYVQNNCTSSSNGLSNWSGAGSFTTGCAPISLPYSQDFDLTTPGSFTNPNPPQCWTYLETPGHAGYGYTYNYSSPNSTPNHWYWYNSSNITDTMMLVSPNLIGLDSADKQVVFWAKSSNSSYTSPCVVGTMSDPNDMSTFTAISTVNAGQNYAEWTVQIDSANGYNGTDEYVAFMYISPVTYRYLYLDDISIENIPACPKPLFVNLGAVTSSSQAVSWSSAGSNFNLEWGPTGFTQGTGFSGTSTTTSYTMTGLAPNTLYDVYIQNNCAGAGNGLSVWVGPITFKTECTPFVGAFTEDFESTASGSSANPSPPDCWKYTTTTHGGYGYGYTRNYATYAHGGSQLFYMYHSNTTDTMALVTPAIDGIDSVDKHIQFWARGAYSGTSYNEHIIIGTTPDPNNLSLMTTIDTVTISGTVYKFFDVYIDAANGYNGTDQYIVMAAWTGTSSYGYFILDDINVADVPSCVPSTALAASNVTNNMADLNWVPGDGGVFNIEYGPTGFVQGTGPVIMGITDSSYTMTGLTGNTTYDVYVRDSCSAVMSPWYGPITFTTSCDPIATPIIEGFETTATGNSTNPSPPACWNFWKNPAASGYGYTYGYSTPIGTKHFYIYNYNLDTMSLISPAVSGLTNGDKMIKFHAKSNNSVNQSYVIVGTSASGADIRNSTVIDTIYTDMSNYTNEFTVHLDSASGYNGTDQYVFLMHGGAAAPYYYVYFDDISIVDIPLCGAPWSVANTATTSSSGTISWSNLYGTGFQVEYGPTGFIPGTGLATTVNNVTSPYTITGLTPNTYYDVYVSDMCDTLNQAGPITFKTDCLAQLSGTYTVGGTPGPNNFATLDSAMSVLGGCGVSGPVTLNLAAGTDTLAISLGEIDGASATNTVTINGAGVGLSTVVTPGGVTIGVNLDATAYITFKNITVDAASANRAVWIHNDGHHITFEDCELIGQTSTSSLYNTFVVSATETSATASGINGHDITLSGCSISGGYYAISIMGASTAAKSSGFVIDGCTVSDAYYYGARLYYVADVEIMNSDLSASYTYGYAAYLYYVDGFNIEGNKLFGGSYGMYLGQANAGTAPSVRSTLINNFGGGNTYGFNGSGIYHINIYNNSFKGASRGAYMSTISNIDLRNNIFDGGSQHAIYVYFSSASNLEVDHNIYNTTSASIAYWQNTTYTTLAAWQTADTTLNVNSLQGDPGFLSSTDFHIVGTLPNDAGDNTVPVTIDIDGDSRPASGSTAMDIGADEFTPLTWDASLEALMAPMGGCGDSTTEVSVVVKNFGLNTITSLPVTVMLSGGMTSMVSTTATVSIGQGLTDTINVGTFNSYAGAVGVDFMAYVGLVGDQKGNNDTLMAGPANYIPAEPVTHGMVDTVCSSVDSVDLWAVYIPGTAYSWYDAPVGGNKVASLTDSVTVPTNGMNTYYVAYDSATANPTIGTGTNVSTSTYITPYKTFYMDGRAQYLVLASELQAMGIAGGGEISSLAFDVVTSAAYAMGSFTIKVGGTSVASMTGSFQPTTGMSVVYTTPSFTPVTGWNVHTFDTPFIWNGADNLIFEICFDNSAYGSNTSVNYTITSFASATDGYADLSSSSGCTPGNISNQQGSNNRPNMQLNMKTIACSEVRKPVSFNVVQDSAYAAFTSTVQLNGADVDFDGSMSVGHIYDWDFGDGTTGSGMMTSHTYAAGTYTACLTVTDTSCGMVVDTMCSTVVATIGLEESLLGQSLNVYPNPSNGNFRIEFQVEGLKNVEVRVNTLLGQEIYSSMPGNISGSYREDIDLSNQATGVYILQVLTDDNVVSRRITIQK